MFELNINYVVNSFAHLSVCSYRWSVHKLYVATVIHMFTTRHMYRFADSFLHKFILVKILDLGVLLGALPQ